ncbi:MAG: ABC transporter transmembrane domain-containing protein, partial [Bacteroidota bacterium]
MKILWRLRIYGKPWSHFFPEYIIYSLLGIVFGLLNFTLLIPILQLLFDQNTNPVTQKPSGLSGLAYIQSYFNYCLWQIIGTYGRFTALLTVCGIVGLSILIGNTARYLAIRTLLRLKLKVMQGIRNDIYGSLLQQSLSYHNNQRRGDLLSVIGGEVQEVEVSALNAVQVLLRDPIVVIAYLFVLFY